MVERDAPWAELAALRKLPLEFVPARQEGRRQLRSRSGLWILEIGRFVTAHFAARLLAVEII